MEQRKLFEGYCYFEVEECYLEDALRLHGQAKHSPWPRCFGNQEWTFDSAYWRTVEVTQSDKDDEGYRVMMFPIGDLKFKV